MKKTDLTGIVDPEIQAVLDNASKVQNSLDQVKRDINTKKALQAFTGFLVLLAFLGLGYLIFTQRTLISTKFTEVVSEILPKQPVVQQVQASTGDSAECNDLVISFENNSVNIEDLTLGRCYRITEKDQDFWQETFDNEANVASFSNIVVGADPNFVREALVNSQKTGILDLRSNPAFESKEPALATETPPALSADSNPTVEITAAATSESKTYDGLIIPMEIEKIVAIMREFNISKIRGEVEQNDVFNWQMFYNNGGEEYLILNTVGMPNACIYATKQITVTLEPFDGATQVADAWVLCE